MKLTLDQIKKITVGALRIWEDTDGVHFSKMTQAQEDAFLVIGNKNALSTTGVRLDFWTDSSFVTYTVLVDARYEVKVDGVLTSHLHATAHTPITVTLPADGHAHRVTICLPSHTVSGAFSCVELADGATLTPHKFDCKMLFIGDSITQGWNSKLNTLSFAYLTSDHFNAESVIQGVGGACYNATTLAPMEFAPDVIVVAYGTNDSNRCRTLSEIEQNCSDYLEKLVSLFPGVPTYVITPPWRTDIEMPKPYGSIRQVSSVIRGVAEGLSLCVIDGFTLIPENPDMMADVLHPNDLGFCVYAHNLIKQLKF
ncbi:MAG: SGNH/GDSL hydrolase family protein [Clostridia bacterium]|nr:SGNH/GDSL hydrolase family protein [Clostridia bacterium]